MEKNLNSLHAPSLMTPGIVKRALIDSLRKFNPRTQARNPVIFVTLLGAAKLLRRNLLVYGLGGLVLPFLGIKLIDWIVVALGLSL